MLSSQNSQISAAVGFFLPLLIAVIQKERWRQQIRVAVGVLACALAAIITTLVEGQFDGTHLATSAFTIFTLTKLTYLSVWKPSGIAAKVETSTGGGATSAYELPAP